VEILITGGYGFIGSHVAEMFFRKGHRVTIIDNISTGNKNNVGFKHTFFHLDVEDPRCEEVFKSNKFDAVIHLAAQINVTCSIKDPYLDTKSNILGLTNMLRLSNKYNVKRFVFASSAAVYGDNGGLPLKEDAQPDPQSPYGISKLVGELYCLKWNKLYGLDTVILRFSNVFGPRQGTAGEGGVISIFMERILEDKELVIFGDGNQTRDFIYVKDVADAIYQSTFSNVTGIFNLSTNTESSIAELVQIMNSLCPIKGLLYQLSREGDIRNSCLDNTKIKNALGWSANFTLEKGLKNTFEWYLDNNQAKSTSKREAPNQSKISLSAVFSNCIRSCGILPYIENLAVFLLAYFLTVTSLNIANYHLLDFMIVYIVLMGAIHGIKQSVLASLLSCASLLYLYSGMGRDIFSLLNDTGILLQLSFYIVIGVVVGYIIEAKNDQLKEKDGIVEDWKEKYTFLDGLHNQTCMVQDELHEQIICNQDSYGKIYSLIKELDNVGVREAFPRAIRVLEDITKSDKVSIYSLTDAKLFAILAAKSDKKEFIAPATLKIKDRQDIQQVIETKDIFINKDFLSHLPVMTAPIIHKNEVIAIVAIHSIPFENLNLYHHNRLKVAVNIISYCITKAYSHLGEFKQVYVYTSRGS
jgi:UDP-glucuronate decarboxylase